MKKNIKNDKVIKAITIGLATMIAATSMPANVFAEDTEGSDAASAPSTENAGSDSDSENTSENTETNESSESSADYSAASETIDACNNIAAEISTVDEGTVDATDAISAASDAVAALAQTQSADAAIIEDVQADLTAGAELLAPVGGEKGTLAQASAAITDTVSFAHATDTYVESSEASIEETNSQLETFNENETKASENADEAIADAEVANTSSSRTEAYEAKDNAEQQLSSAETELEAAAAAYDAASVAAGKAKAEYEEAVKQHDEAVKKADEAKALIASAQTNATAAEAQLKAAQAKVAALESKASKLAEDQQNLEEIRDQYYALMVTYFNKAGDAYKVINEEDGTLNIEESCIKLKANQNKLNDTSSNTGSDYWALGRHLTNLLVKKIVMSYDNVDPETAEYQFGIEGRQVDAYKGTVEDGSVKKLETIKYKWNYPGLGNKGRENNVTVTYKDKDGVLHKEFFNYVSKDSSFGDTTDIENGSFYLVRIEKDEKGNVLKDENGKYKVTRVTDENNYDDYKKLLAAVAAAENIEKYNAAKAAVDEATAKVENIRKELDNLKNVSVNNSVIEALEDKLNQANEDLAAAKKAKEILEDKVAEVRAAVEAIDLSRFNVTPADGSSDEADESDGAEDTTETPAGAVTPSAMVTPTGVTVTVPGLGIAPIVLPAAPAAVAQAGASESTPAGGVLGARVAEDLEERVFGGKLEEGAEEDFVIAPNTDLVEEVFGMDDNETGRKLVKIEDNAVPLAAMPEEDGVKMNWWWLLIILLLGATGKKMYDEHQKKVAAREEANR